MSGRTPISIRDQIVRAQYLIERLYSNGYLQSGSRLLVVGAGAAGCTAAVLAAQRGVDVLLTDRSAKGPFARQQQCKSRWIDPVQYDWPARHAFQAKWPVKASVSGPVPFGFDADLASSIARKWTTTLSLARIKYKRNLSVQFNASLVTLPARSKTDPSKVEALIQTGGAAGVTTSQDFDLIILARGVEDERTAVPRHRGTTTPSFVGLPFWENDQFEDPGFGLSPLGKGTVLVSGGGDGALQDYIRLVTGRGSALEVLQEVLANNRKIHAGQAAMFEQMLYYRINDEENQATRAMIWNENAQQDHTVINTLHSAHREMLRLWERKFPQLWHCAMAELGNMTRGRNPGRVTLVHSCSHFSACYALNRFVTLLLQRFVGLHFSASTIFTGLQPGAATKLVAAQPVTTHGIGHACQVGCWGPQHLVELETGIYCGGTGGGLVVKTLVDGLIVRHGIIQHPGTPVKRHMLPLHLP
ncbi:MAG: hypothetical protein JWQ01_1542 [Massilia sp.]|nr:hypothetical protein [Massilia sp.]